MSAVITDRFIVSGIYDIKQRKPYDAVPNQEVSKETKQMNSWLQTAAIIVTIIGAFIGAVGFLWLNVPSKTDINLLREDMNCQFELMTAEMNRRSGEIRSDIRRLNEDYKNHLDKHNEQKEK